MSLLCLLQFTLLGFWTVNCSNMFHAALSISTTNEMFFNISILTPNSSNLAVLIHLPYFIGLTRPVGVLPSSMFNGVSISQLNVSCTCII